MFKQYRGGSGQSNFDKVRRDTEQGGTCSVSDSTSTFIFLAQDLLSTKGKYAQSVLRYRIRAGTSHWHTKPRLPRSKEAGGPHGSLDESA